MLWRIKEIDHRIEELAKDQGRPAVKTYSSKPPFTDNVMNAPAPRGFKMPTVPQYEGTTDPVDHLETFRTMILLHGASDGFLCRTFPTTLTGAAQDCRFNREALQVSNLDPSAAVNVLLAGTKSNDFRRSIARQNPHSLADLMAGAEEYLAVEETLAALDSNRRRTSEEKNPTKLRRDDKAPRRERSQQRREENYTPLNTSWRSILAAIEGEEFVRWPTRMISKGNKRDKSKYCRFRRDHGHDTDECWQLKEEIELLINRGYQKRYVKSNGDRRERRGRSPHGQSPRRPPPFPVRNQSPPSSSPQQEIHRSQPKGVINTIMGGPAAGGTSSAARKAYAH
ncbi:uncharacterized protein LOC143850556 [Tasmannia lanceolata]|uniref:uncharacterized protein LOC143850554 n=1 Tax=Tasmannia lanceolata TaxID=3420 RepID=UPI0040645B9A